MPNQPSGQPPSGTSPGASPPVQQDIVGSASQNNSNQQSTVTANLAQDVHWITHATFWSQIGLAIIGIVALVIYYGQLCTMNKQLTQMSKQSAQIEAQTTLMTAQLKGTESAFVDVVVEVGSQVGNFDRPFNQAYLIVQNSGHAIATNVRVKISMQLVSMTGKPIGISHDFEYFSSALGFTSGQSGDQRRFIWDSDGHAAKVIEDIKDFKMTARKEWHFEYGNGFGDTIRSEEFCYELLGNDWITCQNFPVKLRSLHEAQSSAKQQ